MVSVGSTDTYNLLITDTKNCFCSSVKTRIFLWQTFHNYVFYLAKVKMENIISFDVLWLILFGHFLLNLLDGTITQR
jgi:EamA domain-containing membrane protein RarD